MRLLWLASSPFLLAACHPSIDLPSGSDSPTGSAAIAVTTLPPSLSGSVSVIAQLVVRPAAGVTLDPSTTALILGPVTDDALRGYRDGDPPSSTSARAITADAWVSNGVLFVVPAEPLSANGSYTVVVGSAMATASLVAEADAVPLLRRTWPPAALASGDDAVVLCGDEPIAPATGWLGAEPEGIAVQMRVGVFEEGGLAQCVTLQGSGAALSWPIPAAIVDGDRVLARLDPTPRATSDVPAPPSPPICVESELPLASLCIQVDDDRLHVRGPAPPLLLSFDIEGAPQMVVTRASSFTVRGLVPSSTQHLHMVVRDPSGAVAQDDLDLTTLAAHPHVVINEVLTYPSGDLASSQWVELFNDGVNDVDLTAFVLDDGHAAVTLPTAVLPAGSYGLVARTGFAPDGVDVAPAPGTYLFTVPHLGKSALEERGTTLILYDAHHQPLSRAPSTPEPSRGVSIARVTPDTPDDDPQAFVLTPGGTPTPGAPNGVSP